MTLDAVNDRLIVQGGWSTLAAALVRANDAWRYHDAGPWIDDMLQLAVGGLQPAMTPVLGIVGFDASTWNGLPLPLDLSAIGMTDCAMFASLDVPESLSSASWSLPVPNDPGLVGEHVFCQALVLHPGSNPLGAVATNALDLRIGRR